MDLSCAKMNQTVTRISWIGWKEQLMKIRIIKLHRKRMENNSTIYLVLIRDPMRESIAEHITDMVRHIRTTRYAQYQVKFVDVVLDYERDITTGKRKISAKKQITNAIKKTKQDVLKQFENEASKDISGQIVLIIQSMHLISDNMDTAFRCCDRWQRQLKDVYVLSFGCDKTFADYSDYIIDAYDISPDIYDINHASGKGRPLVYPETVMDIAIELRQEGIKYEDITELTYIPRGAIYEYMKDHDRHMYKGKDRNRGRPLEEAKTQEEIARLRKMIEQEYKKFGKK